MRTNADLMANGRAPHVLKNGKYEPIELHHSRQKGKGTISEISYPTHKTKKDKGGNALHPYGNNKHPDYPVNRPMFDKDREAYWIDRLNQLKGM